MATSPRFKIYDADAQFVSAITEAELEHLADALADGEHE